MKDHTSRFSLRIESELLDKLGYIASYEGRSKNRELEHIIRCRIEQFESKHGVIYEYQKSFN